MGKFFSLALIILLGACRWNIPVDFGFPQSYFYTNQDLKKMEYEIDRSMGKEVNGIP